MKELFCRTKYLIFFKVVFLLVFVNVLAFAANETKSLVTSDEALQRLMDGNKRYVESALIHPAQTAERRTEVAKGQHPFAVILTCSDSRVPPEVIFDQGLGDLFVIRVAGNIADDAVIGSIEYAAEHLNVPLVVVLGHERCGAVDATVQGGEIPGHINSLVEAIKPAAELAKKEKGDIVDNAVRTNIELVSAKLKQAKPILEEMSQNGKLTIVGAYYDLDDGTVKLLSK